MSTGPRIPWSEANAIAQDCVAQLAPHCSQIDIAGSVRRLRADLAATQAGQRRLRSCPTHGQQSPNAWGCPECVRELRQEADQLRVERDAAQEAVRRLVGCLNPYDSEVAWGLKTWATRDGMTGPLPPMPEWLARREQVEEGGRASASDLEPGL